MNFTVDEDGDSPYNKRFNQGHYNGHMIPFGAKVDFMMPPTNVKKTDKTSDHAPNTQVGIFIGWELQGGKWKNEYKVALLEDFKNVDLKTGAGLEKVRIIVTENVEWHPSATVVYPLQEKYDWLRESHQGIRVDDPKQRTFQCTSEIPPERRPETATPHTPRRQTFRPFQRPTSASIEQ